MLCCGMKHRKEGGGKSTKGKNVADKENVNKSNNSNNNSNNSINSINSNNNNNNKTKNNSKTNKTKASNLDQNKENNKTDVAPFLQNILDRHNQYREHHSVQALQHSQDLTDDAQEWAEQLASMDKLQHDPSCQGKRVGENVAMKYSSTHTDFPGSAFVDSWYSEAFDYKFDGTEDQIACGHFTQVVWKSTKQAGFGKAISKSNKVYVVGRYRPAGNYIGDFCRNVPPPKDGKVLKLNSVEQGKAAAKKEQIVEPVIGPDKPQDIMVETQTVTKTVGSKKVVKVSETYRAPDGSRYTKTKETTEFDPKKK